MTTKTTAGPPISGDQAIALGGGYDDSPRNEIVDANIDVVDYDLGEIRLEGVTRAAAELFIEEQHGEIKEELTEEIMLDEIDGGGTMEVRYIYVRFSQTVQENREWAERMHKASRFWDPNSKSTVDAWLNKS